LQPLQFVRRLLAAELQRALRPSFVNVAGPLERIARLLELEREERAREHKPTIKRGSVVLLGRVVDSAADLEVLAIVPVTVERGQCVDVRCLPDRTVRLTTVLAFGEIGLSDLVIGDRFIAPGASRVHSRSFPGEPSALAAGSPMLLCNEGVAVQVQIRVSVWGL